MILGLNAMSCIGFQIVSIGNDTVEIYYLLCLTANGLELTHFILFIIINLT